MGSKKKAKKIAKKRVADKPVAKDSSGIGYSKEQQVGRKSKDKK